ncbi:MAG: hypothetical protein AAF637_23080 [Pseudomonadota bacterium]
MSLTSLHKWMTLAAIAMSTVACHSSAYDDAWAQCEAKALEALETEDPVGDQRTSDREAYIQECMSDQGFK